MRPVQYISWALVGIGVAGLIFYALKGFFTHPMAPIWAKVLIGIAIIGLVSLLEYLILGRYRKARDKRRDTRSAGD